MHAVFMLYGKEVWVNWLLNDIRAQKFVIKYTSPDGKQTKTQITDTSLRILPFGFYDIVFPKEYKDVVLTTLDFHKKNEERYRVPELILKQIRKALHVEMPKEFNTSEALPWVKGIDLSHQDVAIIPLGIREDVEIADNKLDGWIHEAI